MAESSKSAVAQDPAMTNIFQGMSEETIRLALTMAQLMESKDKNNLEAVMKTLSLTNGSDKPNMPLNEQESPKDLKLKDSENETKPEANGDITQEKLHEQHEEKQSIPKPTMMTTPTHQNEQSVNLSTSPLQNNSIDVQAGQHTTQEDPSRNEDHHEVTEKSSDDNKSSPAPVACLQSSSSEFSQSEAEKESQQDKNHTDNSGHFETEQLSRVNLANDASAPEEKANSQENDINTINTAVSDSQSGASASTVDVPKVNSDGNPSERKIDVPVPVISGLNNVTYSDHPQNFPKDNISPLEERKLSEVPSGGFKPKGISNHPEEEKLTNGVSNGFRDDRVPKTSAAVTIDPETHHANYSTVPALSESRRNDITGQTGLNGLNSVPHTQRREQYEGFTASLPNSASHTTSGLTGLNMAPHSIHDVGFTSTLPNNTTRRSSLTGLESTSQQQEQFERYSTSLPKNPPRQSSLTGLKSSPQQHFTVGSNPDTASLPSVSESTKYQAQYEERFFSPETSFKTTEPTCPTTTTTQTKEHDSHPTSHFMPLSQGTSSSIVTASSAMASMPLYYQPHIVMKDNIPVLMLKPVLVPSLSGDVTSNQTMDLGANSMVFPLNSIQGLGLGSQQQVNDVTLSSDEVSTNLPTKQDFELEPGSGYAASTESESEEKAPRIARVERKRDWITWTCADDDDGDESSMYQAKNPFLDDIDNLSSASSQPVTSSSMPSLNFGHQVSSDIYQYTSSPSSNPFYPEEQDDTVRDDELLRTEFSTIPKSMLASQRVPQRVSQNGSTTLPRVPSVSCEEGVSQIGNEGLSRELNLGQFSTARPLRVPPVSQFDSAAPLRVPPVSQFDNATPLRVPPVSQFGSAVPPRGPSVTQANFNDMSLKTSNVNQACNTSLLAEPPVSHSYGPRGPQASQSFRGPPTTQQQGTKTLLRGPSVSQHGAQPRGPSVSQHETQQLRGALDNQHVAQPRGPSVSQHVAQPRGPSVSQHETQQLRGALDNQHGAQPRGTLANQQGSTQHLRGSHVSQQHHSSIEPNSTPASRTVSTYPEEQRSSDNMLTLLEIKDGGGGNVLNNGTNGTNNFQEPGPSSGRSNFTALPVMSSADHGAYGMTADQSDHAVNAGKTHSQPSKQSETKPMMPGHVAPYWVPDDQVFKCAYCHLKFNFVRRKHHCRGCGKIFCSNCCSQLARLSYLQYQIGRICIFCTHIIKEASKEKKQLRARRKEKAKHKSNKFSVAPHKAASTQESPPVSTASSSSLTGLTGSVEGHVVDNRAATELLSDSFASGATASPIVQSDTSAFQKPPQTQHNTGGTSQYNQPQQDAGGTAEYQPAHPQQDAGELKVPLRLAGQVVSWKGKSFASTLMAQDRKKALAKDLRDLPNGVTMQIADDLQVIVKKTKVQSSPLVQVWCCVSKGLSSHGQEEVAMYFKIKPKEEVIPEEVLRMYKVILDLVKLGHIFKHSNFLAFKSPFLGTSDNAALLFASSTLVTPPKACGSSRSVFLYAILVKRPELEYAQFLPTRYLLRLGQEFKSFPFPIINSRDRATVYDGVDHDDVIYNTTVALNNHFRNSIPEAIITGLTVLQEDSKVVLQLPVESQPIIENFFDRLVIKTNQRATIPLVSDLSTNVDQYRVYHQSIHTDEISLRKHMSLFRNPESHQRIGINSVTGLGFVLLLSGAADAAALEQKGKLVDDGAIVNLTDQQSQRLRQCLRDRSNFSLYLGDQFEILYFELRWSKSEPINSKVEDSRPKPPPKSQASQTEYPGTATIDVRHSGLSFELKKVAEARLGDTLIVVRLLEQRIKRAVTEALMILANRMKAGETKEIVLKLSLRSGMKKWAIGPANQPMYLIRSLQMALYDIQLSDLGRAALDLTFDVTVIKQFDLIAQRHENQR